MTVFVDTSAVVALMNADDHMHSYARTVIDELFSSQAALVTTNYVVVETCALVQRRLGLKAVQALYADLLPVITIKWIDEQAHRTGMNAILAGRRKNVSLVDYISFDCMRTLGVSTAFTFDNHFAEQGFDCLPTG